MPCPGRLPRHESAVQSPWPSHEPSIADTWLRNGEFLLGFRAKIAESSAHEEVGLLRDSGHVAGDFRCRFIDALEFLLRVLAEMHRLLATREYPHRFTFAISDSLSFELRSKLSACGLSRNWVVDGIPQLADNQDSDRNGDNNGV